MTKEIKISLPIYKMAYASFFTVVLSIIRGVTFTYEIGIALEAPMGMLAAVFFADTYTQEIVSRRSEVQRLYPMKKRVCAIAKRILIQEVFLWILAVIGYGSFFVFQDPLSLGRGQFDLKNEISQFFVYAADVLITLIFWGILSNTLACVWRNMWFGIGGSLIIWMTANSSIGDKYLKNWNLFSYTFRNIENSGDFSWLCGKVVCICASIILMAVLPKIIKERG